MFDGWSHFYTRSVDIFATLPADDDQLKLGKNGYQFVLLALSPMEDETSLDADEHMRLI